jgi:GNAT superfamily N-acetyltransferase
MSNLRQFQTSDLSHILDIDLKCYDDPLSLEQWRDLCQSPDVEKYTTLIEKTPMGFICWTVSERYVVVLRLAVKKKYQNLGVGTGFLRLADKYAKDNNLRGIRVVLPESMCYGASVNIMKWLNNRGGTAAMGAKNSCISALKSEDAIVFTFKLGEIKCGI